MLGANERTNYAQHKISLDLAGANKRSISGPPARGEMACVTVAQVIPVTPTTLNGPSDATYFTKLM